MKMNNKNNDFDCVKMKNSIQAQIYAETAGMTFEELKLYLEAHLRRNSFWEKIKTPIA
jgi:hypothetical protein